MHRTEGANNVDGAFTEGPPPTTVDSGWLNSVQEEIVSVIENAGFSLKQRVTDADKNQLWLAIQSIAKIVQTVYVEYSGIVTFVNSNDLDRDANPPVVTDGEEIMSLAITPTSADNRLLVEYGAIVTHDLGAVWISTCLFEANLHATNALKGITAVPDTTTEAGLNYRDLFDTVANFTSEMTFKVRAGGNDGGGANDMVFNGKSATGVFLGPTPKSFMRITEYRT